MSLRRTILIAVLAIWVLGTSTAQAEKHALLVGINEYLHARNLRGSVNDITQVKHVLLKDLGFKESNIWILFNEQATKENILAALKGLAQRAQAGDSVLWYYSGHGFMTLDEDGDEAALDPDDRYDEVLVPYEAVPWPREKATDPNPTMLSDDEIGRALSGLAGKRVVVIFDSCHSGSATRAVGDTDSRSLYPGFVPPGTPKTRSLRRSEETLDMSGSMVFISAASPLQSASDLGEFEGNRHGAFTASLLRTIRSSGPGWWQTASWDGLFRRTRADLLNHGFASQTPSIKSIGGLSKRRVDEFFAPSAAGEIADLDAPERGFEVQLESKKYSFVQGDLLELGIESERDGYLYVFDINAEKKITQLFPNRFVPDNRIKAGELRMIPAKKDRYQFRAGPPFGHSVVVAVVTEKPWTEADRLNLPANFSAIGENKKSGLRDQLRRLHDLARSGSTGAGWSSQKIVLEIVASEADIERAEEFEAPEAEMASTETVSTETLSTETVSTETAVDQPAPEPIEPIKQETSPAPAQAVSPEAAAAPAEVVSGKVDPPTAAVPAPVPAPPTPLPVPSSAAPEPVVAAAVVDDANLSLEDQADLPNRKPALFKKLEQLAKRFSPVFWQDVSGSTKDHFTPWKDFIVRYDFDVTPNGPNWPEPPQFQDEMKRQRVHSLDDVLLPTTQFNLEPSKESPGVYSIQNKQTGESFNLDLRPFVYWAVLTTPTHYFFQYVVYHAEDWKGLFGHPGDLEGATIVVDRKAERMVAAFTLAHDDVQVTRSLDEDPGPNIGVLVDPALEARGLFDDGDDRPIEGALSMDVGRAGEASPKEHQDIYIETKGHGQYGPKKIKKSRYIIYANYLDESTFTVPSSDWDQYPETKNFAEVPAKHKYKLIYIGSNPALQETLWGEYGLLKRFSGGANPPWNWRDNWLFKTGWWKDPRRIKKIGDGRYLINPYLESKKRKKRK